VQKGESPRSSFGPARSRDWALIFGSGGGPLLAHYIALALQQQQQQQRAYGRTGWRSNKVDLVARASSSHHLPPILYNNPSRPPRCCQHPKRDRARFIRPSRNPRASLLQNWHFLRWPTSRPNCTLSAIKNTMTSI